MNQTYGEMLGDWVKGGRTPVIIHHGSLQWDLWEKYYHQFEVNFVLLLLGEGRKSWTVPAHDPGSFDMRFNEEIGRRKMAAKAGREFSMPKVKGNAL